MQLVEQGRVDLDAPLARYVPAFRMLPRFQGNVITARTILDHHSGIPGDVFNGLITQGTADPGYRAWLRKALRKMYPERRVNTRQAYNNSGFVLLQDLIENVTGQPLDTYTQQHLFTPLNMDSSSFNDPLAPDSAVTRVYLQKSGAAVEQPREYVNGWTAGSILSSAADMANYLAMLNADGAGLMAPSTFAEMLTPQTNAPMDISPATFGLSWLLVPSYWAGFMYTHDGATAYNYSDLIMLRDSKLGVFVTAVTANEQQVQAQIASRALSLMYTAKTGIAEPLPAALPTAEPDPPSKAALARRAGFYAGTTGYDHVRVAGRGLLYTAWGGQPVRLTRMANSWWATPNPSLQVRFKKVGGRQLLLQRSATTSGPLTYVAAEQAQVLPVSSPWRERLGTYRATNEAASVPPVLSSPKLTLKRRDGLLLLDLRDGRVQVLQPIRKQVAFTFGTGPTGSRNKGDGVFAHGTTLTYMGVRYERMP